MVRILRMTRHTVRIGRLGSALLVALAACGGPTAAPRPVPEPPRAVLPSPLPLRMAADAAADLGEAPRRVGTGEAAAMGAAATVLGTLGGAIYFGGGCLAGTMGADAGLLALFVCAPVGAVVGGIAGISSGADRLSQAGYSEAEVQAMTAALVRRLAPRRLSDCLRDTLVSRAEGRFVMAGPSDPVALEAGIAGLSLAPRQGASQDLLGQTPFLLSLNVRTRLREPDAGPAASPPAARRVPGTDETWRSDSQGWFHWAANDAALVETEIGLAVGVLAQRILADTFPDAYQRPPSGRPEALRVTCRPPAEAAASP